MTYTTVDRNHRILVIDDNPAIHEDFRKIFSTESPTSSALASMEATLFGAAAEKATPPELEVDFAYQGEEGLAMVRKANEQLRPYAMAFVDVRMPPGWDGVETIARIWNEYPDLQVVICTAYSDYSWGEVVTKLCRKENLLILKKPFDNIEALQLASALTEKWRLSRQTRLRIEDLETIVAERMREINDANDELWSLTTQLTAAKEAAEAANAAKARFLASVSHEIRTPLTAVLGYADLLLEPDQSADQKAQCVHTIRKHGDNLLQIINDILDLSKIEAGRLKLEQLSCSPGAIVAEVIDLLSVRAEPKGLKLTARCDGPIPSIVRTDPFRLRQILTNLIGNAIKFTESGNVTASVRSVAPAGESEPTIEFRVADTGIGIEQEALRLLFAPFAQANVSISRQFGGTGLGLVISKKLTEMLGGQISVESTPGHGSTFTFTIRADAVSGARLIDRIDAVVATGVEQRISAPVSGKLAGRILLAEDSPDNQRLLAHILKKAGAQVDVVADGRAAVDAALQGAYDVILMDMQMPKLDGYEATSLLRREGYAGPIVALTANAMSTDRAKCIEAGCNDYATKPIDRSALLRTLGEFMTQSTKAAVPNAG